MRKRSLSFVAGSIVLCGALSGCIVLEANWSLKTGIQRSIVTGVFAVPRAVGYVFTRLKKYDKEHLNFLHHSRRPLKPLVHYINEGDARTSLEQGYVLGEDEVHALETRALRVRSQRIGICQHTQFGVAPENPLRIGLCLSGGGYRAMTAMIGFGTALETIGILDMVLYMSVLSGSTWGTATWFTLDKSWEDLAEHVKHRLATNWRIPYTRYGIPQMPSFSSWVTLTQQLLGKVAYDQPVGPVDFFGWLLANDLLRPRSDRFTSCLSNQCKQIEEGRYPLPLYTLITPTFNDKYLWLDCSPYAVGSFDLNGYVKTPFFGRTFYKGISLPHDTAPELPLSFFLGSCGSIFGMPLHALYDVLGYVDFFHTADSLVHKRQITLGTPGVVPGIAQINNFLFHHRSDKVGQEPYIDIMDAGVDFNVPVPPLLRRAMDIIIICDVSRDPKGKEGLSLVRAAEYAQEHSMPFPSIDQDTLSKDIREHKTFFVFPEDIMQRDCQLDTPVVLYFPLGNDGTCSHCAHFDVVQAMKSDFCMTFNFKYERHEFDMLNELVQHNVVSHKDEIMAIIGRCAQLR